MKPLEVHTFIHRTFLELFNRKISSSLQGSPLLIPCEMDLVSSGSGHFSLDTKTLNVIFKLVSPLKKKKKAVNSCVIDLNSICIKL